MALASGAEAAEVSEVPAEVSGQGQAGILAELEESESLLEQLLEVLFRGFGDQLEEDLEVPREDSEVAALRLEDTAGLLDL